MTDRRKTHDVAARHRDARQRVIYQLARLPASELRHVQMATIAALGWSGILEMILLREKMRTPPRASIAAWAVRWGWRIGRSLDRLVNRCRNLKPPSWN